MDNQRVKEFNMKGEMNSRIVHQPIFESNNVRIVKIKELLSPEIKIIQDGILK